MSKVQMNAELVLAYLREVGPKPFYLLDTAMNSRHGIPFRQTDRACQWLRKRGLITHDRKTGWKVAP